MSDQRKPVVLTINLTLGDMLVWLIRAEHRRIDEAVERWRQVLDEETA